MISTDFFKINLPYGMVKNSKNEWAVFNRMYLPNGFNSIDSYQNINDEDSYLGIPIRKKYINFTETVLKQLIDHSTSVEYDGQGNINKIWFYNDLTNPIKNELNWRKYFKKIQLLSRLKIETNLRD